MLCKTKARTFVKEISLNYEGRNWEVCAVLFANDAVLLDESEERLQ